MRKQLIIGMFAAALMFASCGSKTTTMEKEMNTLSFNQEQAAFMSAIACNEAKADYTALAEAINGGCTEPRKLDKKLSGFILCQKDTVMKIG